MKVYSTSDDWSSVRSRHSDLDWALHSPVVKTYGHRGPSDTWQCGDRRRLKQVVSQFVKHSSMHGVRYICSRDSRRSWFNRLSYRFLFAGCVVAMLASVTFLLQESFSKESVYVSSTSKEVKTGRDEDRFFPLFPRIILCRRPVHRMGANVSERELLEYAFLSLGYPFSPLTPEERTLMVGIKIFQMRFKGSPLPPPLRAFSDRLNSLKRRYDELKETSGDFNLTEFVVDNGVSCRDIFIRCIAFVFTRDCCEIFHPTMTALGNCYSLVLDHDLLTFFQKSADITFHFSFDLHASPNPGKAVETGYEVYLLDPRDNEMAIHPGGHALINGFMTTMKTRLIKTSRVALYTAWHGLCTRCPKLPVDLDLLGHGDRYFRVACEKMYLSKLLRDRCGCRYVSDKSNVTMRLCDPEDVYGCFVVVALHDNLTGMAQVCRYPCLEYNYQSEVNFVKLGVNNSTRLFLTYDGTHYSLQEYRTTTMSGFLSQIGGALGLYVGASIITAVELFAFLMSWVWYQFFPHKRASTSDASAILRRRAKEKEFYLY